MVRPECPPRKERFEDLVPGTLDLQSGAFFIVLKLRLWDRSPCVPAYGFDDSVGRAENVAEEGLGVGVEADGEGCGARVLFVCGGVGEGPGCYGAGGAVGQEGGIGGYVGDEGV